MQRQTEADCLCATSECQDGSDCGSGAQWWLAYRHSAPAARQLAKIDELGHSFSASTVAKLELTLQVLHRFLFKIHGEPF